MIQTTKFNENEATALIMAALYANIDRAAGCDSTDNEDSEDEAWLDGYVAGLERAALTLGKALGHEALARKLGAA